MEPLKTSELPLALQQAVSIVRPGLKTRLTDRTYMNTVGSTILAVIGCVTIWRTPGVPIDDKINTTMAAIVSVSTVIALWNHKQTSRDETIWKAALEASNPSLAQTAQNAQTALQTPIPLTQNLTIGESTISSLNDLTAEPLAPIGYSFPENGAPIQQSSQLGVMDTRISSDFDGIKLNSAKGVSIIEPLGSTFDEILPHPLSEGAYVNSNVEVIED